jgi:hypothetical protein
MVQILTMTVRILSAAVIVWACGCGGGAAASGEAETAGAGDSFDSERESAGEEGSPQPSEESESPAEASEVSGTLDEKELESVLQSVLADPQLLESLKLGKPGRAPLKVAGPDLPAKLAVLVGSHHVKVVEEAASAKAAVLVFEKIERTGDQVRVFYRFDAESLKGRASLFFRNGGWELSANRVVTK